VRSLLLEKLSVSPDLVKLELGANSEVGHNFRKLGAFTCFY